MTIAKTVQVYTSNLVNFNCIEVELNSNSRHGAKPSFSQIANLRKLGWQNELLHSPL